MITIHSVNFPRFLESKFLEWQNNQGERRTVAEFANWIGVKQSTLSMWWNSGVSPSGESVRLLSEKLGLEVYDVLNIPRPNADLHYLQKHWDELSPEVQRALREQAEEFSTKNEAKRLSGKRRTKTSH